MNILIDYIASNEKPKATLTEPQEGFYSSCVRLLATVLGPGFIDIPLLKNDDYEDDGLFYAIPYIHNPEFEINHNSHTLIVAYKVNDRSASCPVRVAFEFVGDTAFEIVVIYEENKERQRFVIAKGLGDKNLSVVSHIKHLRLSQFVTA